MDKDVHKLIQEAYFKLAHVIEDMQIRMNYFVAPGAGMTPVIVPGNQEKWIAKLTMTRNSLEMVLKKVEKEEKSE